MLKTGSFMVAMQTLLTKKVMIGMSVVVAGGLMLTGMLSSVSSIVKKNQSLAEFVSEGEIINRFIATAEAEEGTLGGGKYIEWYGGSQGQAWCNMFVSWCAEQNGLIKAGIVPKEALCYNSIQWYKQRNLFQYTSWYGGTGYQPKRGDLIFFTWKKIKDPPFGHIGIVTSVEGNTIHTIEGNTGNKCQKKARTMSPTVLGFATPNYNAMDSSFLSGYSPTQVRGNQVSEQVWNYLKDQGFSDEAAAGVMGNIQQESSMDPAAIEKRNGEGHGLCQWSFGRKQRLFERAAAAGKPWQDIGIQLQLLMDELNGLDSSTKKIMDKKYGGLNNFKQTTDIVWAVKAFEDSFERAGAPAILRRISYAQNYYIKYHK